MAEEIPADVRAYLLAGDGLGMVSVMEKYPGVEARVKKPEVQMALYRYLGSEEPWGEQIPVLAMAALDAVLATPTQEGAKSVRKLAAHPHAGVRLRVYNYMFALVYPGDRVGMSRVVEEMLTDDDETVRLGGAHYLRNMKLAGEMRGYLQNWVRQAPERKMDRGESYAIVKALAK